MRISRTIALLVASSVAAATFAVATPATAFANDSTTTPAEVAAALDKVDARNDALVAAAVPSTIDGDSAAQTASVDIPADATKGVKLIGGSQTITIGLPNAKQGGKGFKNGKGVVVYSGRDGSANAAIPADGGVQLLTTIESKKAPTSYAYTMTGNVTLTPEGAALLTNNKGEIVAAVPPAWAKDANGKSVATRFVTDGKSLTQVVDHRVRGVAYPVVADPIVIWLFGLTVYCFIAGSWEARNMARNSPWYVWVWGMFVACLPL